VALTFLETDHASLASVRSSAHTFLSAATRLDLLILNAGIMAVPPALTPDGYEVQFGVNHLSHALLVKLLLPTLRSTAQQPGSDVRVVAVASLAFSGHPSGGIRFDTLQTPQAWWLGGAWQRYGQAKLANILYAAELARRHPYAESKITFLSIHPGTFNTHLITSLGVVNRAMSTSPPPFSRFG
jgi:NAD(P)-dependent dehydrogenase (short-subunit alcohol dehydrogenase family)